MVAVVVGVHTIWNQQATHRFHQAKWIEDKELKQQAAEANWTKEDVDNLVEDLRQEIVSLKEETRLPRNTFLK